MAEPTRINNSLATLTKELIVNQPEQKNSLSALKKNSVVTSLSDEEQKIVELKYKSKQLREMTDVEVKRWSKSLLIKIHVITGWSIPVSDEMLNILEDQFIKLLQEKYSSLNPDEIEFAFRQNGTTIQDWGKSMNLQLIDSILIPYLNQRLHISESERHIAYFKKRDWSFEHDINWRGMIEEEYQRFRFGNYPRMYRGLSIFPPHFYQVLEDDGAFFPKDWYKERLDMYMKKYPKHDAGKLFYIARDRCVLQLFRVAARLRSENLYVKSND